MWRHTYLNTIAPIPPPPKRKSSQICEQHPSSSSAWHQLWTTNYDCMPPVIIQDSHYSWQLKIKDMVANRQLPYYNFWIRKATHKQKLTFIDYVSLVNTLGNPQWCYGICALCWYFPCLVYERRLGHFWKNPCVFKVILCIKPHQPSTKHAQTKTKTYKFVSLSLQRNDTTKRYTCVSLSIQRNEGSQIVLWSYVNCIFFIGHCNQL